MTKHISKLLTGLLLLVSLGVNAQQYAKITYIHTEADGSVFAATDEDGNLEWKIDHTPFGNEIRNTATGRNNDLSYTGKPFDEEIGLSYYGARWYDPVTGRFTGIDPAPIDPNDFRRFNRYAYGFNSPYRYNDPDGRVPVDYAVDGISVGISAALFANDPSLANGLGLAADTVLAVIPYVPAGVGLIRGGDKALESATAAKGTSNKVQDVMDAINQNDVKVKVNPRNQATKQEGNVTLDFGDGTKANLRVETHPLSQNGLPIRHGNVEVTKQVKNKNKVIKNTHITDD